MASADQLKALLKSHLEGDDDRFFSVAMQVAAHEAKLGHGKLAEELRTLIDEAKGRRGVDSVVPIARPRGELANLLEASYPKARLGEMVLSDALADQIQRVLREQRYAGRIVEHGLAPRRKLLLTGPPGTGKTLTGFVLAGELGLPLLQVRLDGLITKFMGETAAQLRQIFDATSKTRGIYFFDEFDAIGSQRGLTNDVGEIRRILNSFLQIMAFVARLSDVAPDGTSAQVTMGVLNGTRRNSHTDPEPIEPGEIYELHVDLDATAWRFERGHRIRLSISSADFPNLWPTPYRGTNRVYRDSGRESYLELPVVPTREAPAGELPPDEMEYEPSAAPRRYPEASPRVVPWEIAQDVMRDRTGLRLHLVNESRASAGMTVKMESRLEVWTNNRDPADTTATGRHFRTITRTDGVINVDTSANVRSTRDAFHVSIELDVRIDGLTHHRRSWVDSFNRELL